MKFFRKTPPIQKEEPKQSAQTEGAKSLLTPEQRKVLVKDWVTAGVIRFPKTNEEIKNSEL